MAEKEEAACILREEKNEEKLQKVEEKNEKRRQVEKRKKTRALAWEIKLAEQAEKRQQKDEEKLARKVEKQLQSNIKQMKQSNKKVMMTATQSESDGDNVLPIEAVESPKKVTSHGCKVQLPQKFCT